LDRSHPLAAALVDWNREHLITRVPLGRLSRGDTGALLATLFGQESVSDEFASAFFRETEGNPFFVEEVVKSLIEQGQIYREDGRWARKQTHELTIPQSVKEAIGRRLGRLSEAAIDALRSAAALGKIFPFRELAAVSDESEDALLDALDEASAAQLIRAKGGDDRFAFTHDKIREVLYEELNPVRRRRLHQRIGETLEKLYGVSSGDAPADRADPHAQDLAYHFVQSGDLQRALTYLRRAARNAERVFAHEEALHFLEEARESAEALDRPQDAAAIDEDMGDVHETRGLIQPAVACYERALARTTTRGARAALKAKLGNAYVPVGDPRGLAYLEQALAELDPKTQVNALALATALVGRYYHYRAEPRRAIEFLERARQLAEPLGDPSTLTNIYQYLAGAHQHVLEYDESDRWSRASIELGEQQSFPEAIASGNEFLAENAAGRGRWTETLAFAARDREQGLKIGSMARVAWSEFCVAQARHGRGELDAALAAARSGLELCEQLGEERLANWLDPIAALAAADLGDEAAAGMHAERAWERARSLDQLVLSAWSLGGLGYAALQRGDMRAALAWFEQYATLTRATENAVAQHLVLARAADAFVRAGRLDDAASLIERAIAIATTAGADHYRALARRVQGQLFAAKGDEVAALRAFEDAVAAFARIGSRLEHARALHQLAALRLARGAPGERDAALADAASAYEAFIAMGASPDRRMSESLLR
ncbi:MAG TPA: hypothetical protein VFF44_08785, partial [Casimicrobiaceae bacterium]|nr:hypothetical protein [Casimicrobiaceae bacterium]